MEPVRGEITDPLCSWGIYIREPGLPGLEGSLRWDNKVWLRVLRYSDHWVIALQTADPSSRQRERPTETRPQIPDSNIPTGSNIWSQVPQGCSIPRRTDWLTVTRKVTLTWTESTSIQGRCEGDIYSAGSLRRGYPQSLDNPVEGRCQENVG
jgi:hypothetical protein